MSQTFDPDNNEQAHEAQTGGQAPLRDTGRVAPTATPARRGIRRPPVTLAVLATAAYRRCRRGASHKRGLIVTGAVALAAGAAWAD